MISRIRHWNGTGYLLAGLMLLASAGIIAFGVIFNVVSASALLVGALVCVLALLQPRWGLWGLFIILPFIYFFKRLDFFIYHDPSSEYNNPVSIVPEIIMLTLLGSILIRSLTPTGKVRVYRSPLTYSVVAFVGLGLLQIANPASSLSIGLYGFRNFSYYVLAFFLGQYLVTSRKDAHRFMILSLSMASVVAVYGLWQQFVAVPAWDKEWVLEFIPEVPYSWLAGHDFAWGELRKFSFLKSSVSTALFYALNTVLCVALFWRRRRWRFVVAGLVLVTALVFTYVRGSWLALAVSLLVMATLWRNRHRAMHGRRALISLVLLVAAGGLLLFLALKLAAPALAAMGTGLGDRLSSLANPMASPQLRSRLFIWQDAWHLALRHPLGIGVGATGGVADRFEGYGVVDNLYLKLSVELGWLGVLLFAIVVWQAVRRAWQAYTRCENRFDKLIAISAIGFMGVILIDGLVAPSLEYDISTILFWLWLGVLDRVPDRTGLADGPGGQAEPGGDE